MNQDTFCSSHLNLIIPYSTFLNLDISCTIYLILDIFYSYCGNLDIPFFLPKPGYIFPFLTWTWIYAAQCSFFTLTWICCSSYLNLDIFFSFYTQTWIYCYSCLNLDTICSLYLTLDIILSSPNWSWKYSALPPEPGYILLLLSEPGYILAHTTLTWVYSALLSEPGFVLLWRTWIYICCYSYLVLQSTCIRHGILEIIFGYILEKYPIICNLS